MIGINAACLNAKMNRPRSDLPLLLVLHMPALLSMLVARHIKHMRKHFSLMKRREKLLLKSKAHPEFKEYFGKIFYPVEWHLTKIIENS